MLDKSLEFLNKAKAFAEGDIAIRLANEGKSVVDLCYSSAEGRDGLGYELSVTPYGKNGATLKATGEDIIFREFGAGMEVATDKVHGEGLPPISPGSWSASEGTGEFAKYGSWHYKHNDGIKRKYTGLRPTLGMYYAFIEIRNKLRRYFREEIR